MIWQYTFAESNNYMIRRELRDRTGIQFLVDEFYRRVRKDPVIGYIFNDAANFSWETHIPVMVDFWETVLLGTTSYKGNPMVKHIELNRRTPLTEEHFARWKKLFFETLDAHFTGEKAAEAKKRAESIAALMMYKIAESGR